MARYLLSTYTSDQTSPPATPGDMQAMMRRIVDLESEMDESGTFVFGGALHGPEATTVVSEAGGEFLLTDGPFVESKEHIGGFYVIEAADLDEALDWAGRVVSAIGQPIEVRPFRATGKAADSFEMPGT